MAPKKTTIYDIAQLLNISVGTVYRALHNTGRISPVTKQKILDKAQELNFRINQSAQGIRREPVTIGVLLCCPILPFLEEIRAGIEYEFSNLSQYNYYADIRQMPPLNADDCAELINEALQDFHEKRYGGVILFLSGSSEGSRPALEQLEEAGMPMVCLVNDLPYRNKVAFVRADGQCAGQIAAELLSLSCNQQNIAILTGDSSIHIHKENLAGFMEEARRHQFASMRIYEHKDHPELVTQKLEEIFSCDPPYQGLYITSASSIIASPYLMELNKEKKLNIIATDLYYPIKVPLQRGIISATIFQNPFLQGRKAASNLYNHLQHHAIHEDIRIAPQIVMRSNVEMYHIKQPELNEEA